MVQQKALQVLAGLGEYLPRRGSRPHHIANRFVGGIGHAHRRQLSGSLQPGQRGGIAAIGLYPVARPVTALRPIDEPIQRLRSAWDLPRKRTSPPRPGSAIATDVILLRTPNVVASLRPVSYA
jgi:hypothetical protein